MLNAARFLNTLVSRFKLLMKQKKKGDTNRTDPYALDPLQPVWWSSRVNVLIQTELRCTHTLAVCILLLVGNWTRHSKCIASRVASSRYLCMLTHVFSYSTRMSLYTGQHSILQVIQISYCSRLGFVQHELIEKLPAVESVTHRQACSVSIFRLRIQLGVRLIASTIQGN